MGQAQILGCIHKTFDQAIHLILGYIDKTFYQAIHLILGYIYKRYYQAIHLILGYIDKTFYQAIHRGQKIAHCAECLWGKLIYENWVLQSLSWHHGRRAGSPLYHGQVHHCAMCTRNATAVAVN